jgi:hypothetical protein
VKHIRVNAAPARAFDTLTAGMRRWWRGDYTINKSPIQDIVMGPH